MRRVVVTGLGIVSSLGNNKAEVKDSLYEGRSGITFQQEYADRGLRSHVAGSIKNLDIEALIDRKLLRFMAKGHAYAWLAMQEAIADSKLPEELVSNVRTGLIVGAGGTSTESMLEATNTLAEKGIRRVGPYMVTKTMSSGIAACLATGAKIKGVNYGISSACSTSAHCIGAGVEQIQLGKQDIVFAGGGEEEHWTMSFLFDAMGALSSKYNETPEKASRTYDADRDGFVISGGGGILVLEEYEHAKASGAKIYCEIAGQGLSSDGYHIAAPDPSGAGVQRAVKFALRDAELTTADIVHLNAHATSTPAGDVAEANALRAALGKDADHVAVSATKSMTGHLLGGAGAIESVFIVKTLQDRMAPPTINIENLDPAVTLDVVRDKPRALPAGDIAALNDSFGFGGHNVVLVFKSI